MSAAYDPALWKDFGVMVGGASAALAGLLVVSMSINIDQILAFKQLPQRAAGALISSLTPLVVCMLLLVPSHSMTAFGIELIAVGLFVGYSLFRLSGFRRSQKQTVAEWALGILLPVGLVVLGLVVAGVSLLVGVGGGLYWIVPALMAALILAIGQAWVLLIEIRR